MNDEKEKVISSISGPGLVVSSNSLVHAKYSMTLWQKRLFMYAVSMIPKDTKEFDFQRIYYVDLLNYFESSGGSKVYEAIREAPKMLDMTIEVPYLDERGNARYGYVKILSKYTIPADDTDDNRYIEIKFNDDLKPHLLDLQEHFMRYHMDDVKKLRSSYSFRIYELLKSHQYKGKVEFTVEYLREILHLEDRYKLYGDFKRNIIEKAKEELDEGEDVSFEYEEVKRRRKVKSIKFTIISTDQVIQLAPDKEKVNTLPLSPNSVSLTPEQRDLSKKHMDKVVGDWNVSMNMYLKLIQDNAIEDIEQAVRVTSRKMAETSLDSPAGFFVEAVRKNFTDRKESAELSKQKQLEINKQIKALEIAKLDIKNRYDEHLRKRVAELTKNDASIAEAAVAFMVQTKFPMAVQLEESVGRPLKVEDFRDGAIYTELLINTIIKSNEKKFVEIQAQYLTELNKIDLEISKLRKNK